MFEGSVFIVMILHDLVRSGLRADCIHRQLALYPAGPEAWVSSGASTGSDPHMANLRGSTSVTGGGGGLTARRAAVCAKVRLLKAWR